MTIIRERLALAPQVEPLKGTLLDAVQVENLTSFYDPEGGWQSYNCLQTRSIATFPCPEPDPPVEKEFAETGYSPGFRFAVYGGFVCKSVGLDQAEAQARVTRAFEAQESIGVENAIMSTRFTAQSGLWDAPEDITPSGGAVSPLVGLALLEGHAASLYAGPPLMHLPRSITTLVWQDAGLKQRGDVYYTPQGSKVASGGGYEAFNIGPDGDPPADGEKVIYATGEIVLQRSELINPMEMNTTTNEVFVLAERLYVATVDCYTAAVRVKVE